MVPPVAQFGIPGTQELLIIVMIFFVVAVPVVAIALVIKLLTGSGGADEERIAELEREVAELRAERGPATDEPDDRPE